jgi:hypothetical protein
LIPCQQALRLAISQANLYGQAGLKKPPDRAPLGIRKGTSKDRTPTGTTRSGPSKDGAEQGWQQPPRTTDDESGDGALLFFWSRTGEASRKEINTWGGSSQGPGEVRGG